MGTISKPNTFSAGATIIASEHNSNFDTVYNEFNGNIENVNVKGSAAIANSKLNLSSIAQNVTHTGSLTMSSNQFLFAKGADVASATSITLGTDGNHFDITGTTNIQTITAKQAGSVVWLQFDGSLTLIDNTGNLELRGHNIPVVTEDVVCLVCDGTNWLFVSKTGNLDRFLIPEISAAPSTAVSEGALYTKDTVGQPELFFREESDGDEVQITSSGSLKNTFIFKQSSAFSGSSSVSITQTVSAGDEFLFFWEGIVNTNTFEPAIKINSATNNYSNIQEGYHSTNTSPTNWVESFNTTSSILLTRETSTSPHDHWESNGSFTIKAYISTRNSITHISYAAYSGIDGEMIWTKGFALYKGGTPTSVQLDRISGTGTVTGRYYVYQFGTS